MNNAQVADVFENIAGLLEIGGEPLFTVRAYQRAARTIQLLPAQLERMVDEDQDLREIPGIGKALAEKIKELVNTGDLAYYRKLEAEFPDGILDVMRIPGVGPKITRRLWKELGATTVAELEQAASDGRLEELPRLGKKTAENILRQIQFARTKDQRTPISRALPAAERIMAALREQCPGVTQLVPAGSLRRFEETVGDIDLVCTASPAKDVLDALVALRSVTETLGHGGTKASVVIEDGIQVDLRVVEDSHFGSLLQYFTGSKQHNIQLRDYANRMGLSLNEYAITDLSTDEAEEFSDEEAFYARLGLQYIPPEIRTGMDEISAAADGRIPPLIRAEDVKGDLHAHTDWSDGRDSMDAMLVAAMDRGLEYVAITDHSVGRGIANGLTPERLRDHTAALREAEARVGHIRVLSGTEMDIRADGSLDYSDELLAELDWVVASVHSSLTQEPALMTKRIIGAMRNPHVDSIGHLSGRLIGERQPAEADYDVLLGVAAETGTALEINGSLERLDLKDTHVYRARELGVPLVITSDSHTAEAFDNLRHGVSVAKRGWCEARHVLNTWRASELLAFLKTPKAERGRVFASRG